MIVEKSHMKTEFKVAPKLRFGEFSNSWDISKFDTYCNFQQGVQVDVELHKEKYEDGYIKFLRIENYTQKSNDFRFIPDLYKESKRIDEDDIVVVRYGATAGYIGRGFTGILANNLFKIIPDKNIFNKDYLYQYLISFRVFKFFQTEMAGGAMPALSFGIVKHLKVPITSISEQQKIASFLSAVDKKLQQLTEKKELLEDYKKGVMQQMFSQELRFKDEFGNNYPDWEENKFGEVFERITQKNKENNQNVLTISAQQGLINQLEYFTKSVSAKDVSGYYLLEKGDFAYNKSYSKGYPLGAIKKLNRYDKGVVSTLYICFRVKELVSSVFFEKFFDYGGINKEINKIAQEGARNHGLLNISVIEFFRDIIIRFPKLEEQEKIANFLSSLDSKIDSVSTQIENTKAFKKGLLQQMFV